MPRGTLSIPGIESLTAHDTDAAWVCFLAIGLHHHEGDTVQQEFDAIVRSGENKLYVCNNNVDTFIQDPGSDDGIERRHIPYPFEITLSDASIDRSQRVQLLLDNIDRTLIDVLRRAEFPLQINFSLGMVIGTAITIASDGTPITPYAKSEGAELFVTDLDLVEVSWDEAVITGTLRKDDVLDRAFPSNHPYYEAQNFPGLFGTRGFDDYNFNLENQ